MKPATFRSHAVIALWLIALGALGGCGARTVHRPSEPTATAMTLTVFNDGFHSGFILPYEGMPIELDRQRRETPEPLPFVEIGFGEARWMQGLDRSLLHAMRIGLWPSPGMLLLVNLPQPERREIDAPGTRYWQVQLTAAGKAAAYAEIDRWLDRGRIYVRPPADPQFFYQSRRSYTLFRDCHDFTLEVLAAAGFPLGSRLVNTSGALDRQMERGLQLLRASGLTAIGP